MDKFKVDDMVIYESNPIPHRIVKIAQIFNENYYKLSTTEVTNFDSWIPERYLDLYKEPCKTLWD